MGGLRRGEVAQARLVGAHERVAQAQVGGDVVAAAPLPIAEPVVAVDGKLRLAPRDRLVQPFALGGAARLVDARGLHLARQRGQHLTADEDARLVLARDAAAKLHRDAPLFVRLLHVDPTCRRLGDQLLIVARPRQVADGHQRDVDVLALQVGRLAAHAPIVVRVAQQQEKYRRVARA